MQWTAERLSSSVGRITFTGKSLWVFLSSDWHWDSTKCDRDRLARDLGLAKKIGAPVLAIGDLFDAMGGKFDPRGTKDGLRPELLVGNYFDESVSQMADWLKPYSANLALISPGNHETAIRKRQETCLTSRIVGMLRAGGSNVLQGSYAGWLLFRWMSKKHVSVYKLWYHHGYGGGGPVTRGVIDYARFLADVDADAILSGHVHQKTLIEASRQRITTQGNAHTTPIHLIRTASYKADSLTDGWAVEKGISSRPLGGWWLRLQAARRAGDDILLPSFHDTPEL